MIQKRRSFARFVYTTLKKVIPCPFDKLTYQLYILSFSVSQPSCGTAHENERAEVPSIKDTPYPASHQCIFHSDRERKSGQAVLAQAPKYGLRSVVCRNPNTEEDFSL